LSSDYTSKSRNKNTKFFIEIRDTDNQNKRYFKRNLSDTSGNLMNKLFILPGDLVEKRIKFWLGILTNSSGEHVLTVKRADIIFFIKLNNTCKQIKNLLYQQYTPNCCFKSKYSSLLKSKRFSISFHAMPAVQPPSLAF